jgi:hypothetical protein
VRRLALVPFLLVAVLLAGCGGDDETSPESLNSRLLPASEVPGFKVKRRFEWDNAIDLTAQGFFLPQSTPPSEVVEVAEEAGFEAGVGEELEMKMGLGMIVIAAKFGSDDGARDMVDRLHRENLQQPCYGVCSQIQSDLPVTGIPDAKGAQSLPDPKPPPNAPPPFVGYAVEFAVGPYLYVVGASGPAPEPGAPTGTPRQPAPRSGGGQPPILKKQQVLDAAAALYKQVKG